jgi:hypothetical protein
MSAESSDVGARGTDTIIFDDLLEWGPPSSFDDAEPPAAGKWGVHRGFCGATSGLVVSSGPDRDVPELRLEPGLTGWYDVAVRVYHGNPFGRGYGCGGFNGNVHVGTTNDRGLCMLRAEVATEDFETLSLGPRDMTGAALRIDGAFDNCLLDSVLFTPCEPPGDLPPPEKELCAVLDFADARDDCRPMEACAVETVRIHAAAGFTTLFWKAYAVRAEFHSHVAPRRRPEHQAEHRVNIGHLLDRYDTLAAAVEEAHRRGVKILGWMRINNEMTTKKKTADGESWNKFSDLPPFHQAHPEMRERYKDGTVGPKLSFAYPEVRGYLCSIAREILDYGVDGLMIDVLRHPPMTQYDQPLVDAFIKETGEDPRQMDGHGTEAWLRFKATAFTDLLRDFRQLMDAEGHTDKPLYVRAMPQPWRLLRDGCDVDAWMREGLVDTFVAGHHCITAPGMPPTFDLAPIQQLIDGRARLIAQVLRQGDLHSALALARQAHEQGADGTAIYESNQMVTLPSYRDAVHRLRSDMSAGTQY